MCTASSPTQSHSALQKGSWFFFFFLFPLPIYFLLLLLPRCSFFHSACSIFCLFFEINRLWGKLNLKENVTSIWICGSFTEVGGPGRLRPGRCSLPWSVFSTVPAFRPSYDLVTVVSIVAFTCPCIVPAGVVWACKLMQTNTPPPYTPLKGSAHNVTFLKIFIIFRHHIVQ